LGYGLQYTRLTAMLLEASEGAYCSMEVLDDVVEHGPTDGQRLVQSKSALTDNPVADRATSLWKSLFNWLQLIRGGFVKTENTIFELYVSRPVSGMIVSSFHEAETSAAASAALDEAKRELWGHPPDFQARKAIRSDLAQYVNSVLEAKNSEILPLIQRMQLTCGSGSPQADIETIIRTHPVPQSKIGKIADYICGWVKRRVDERLEKSLPAVISRDEFHTAYTACCRAENCDTILRSLGRHPTEPEKTERLPDDFVQQLDLIDVSFEDKLEAVSDFLRACWDRAHWAEVGDVDEYSFDELDASLKRTWKNHAQSVALEHRSLQDVERGQRLLLKCVQHAATVQGMTPPSHFVPGCFHRLADEMEVGWHPKYKQMLRNQLVDA
jgi:hypothetical protein